MVQVLESEYDLVGIGFGPANIGLAIALEESNWAGSVLFLEQHSAPDWQGEMLLDSSDIQHNPHRDFITPRNPQSRYTFLNFLKSQGRLLDYLNLDAPFALRKDYAEYIRWTARHFDRWASYGQSVKSVKLEPSPGTSSQKYRRVRIELQNGKSILAKCLSFAPGRSALVPDIYRPHLGDRVEHFTRYTTALSRWRATGNLKAIAVVGASQSAVEIILDLHTRMPNLAIHNIQRGFGFKLKDTSPFTEKIYLPEFTETFYNSSFERQKQIRSDLWRSNYGSADADVIHRLHMLMYEQRLDGRERIHIHTDCHVSEVTRTPSGVDIRCDGNGRSSGEKLTADAVILATGFRNFGSGTDQELWHPMLDHIAPHAAKRPDGSLAIARDYRLRPADDGGDLPAIFINGLCEATHGFGDAGSFSLLAQRSQLIAEGVANVRQKALETVSEAA